jgi:hypothetical protein
VLQQCKSLIQVIRWYEEGRVMTDARVARAGYEPAEFSPNLDFQPAAEIG